MSTVRAGRATRAELAALVAQRADAPLSYDCVGISLSGDPLPTGWGSSTGLAQLGPGDLVWEQALEALRGWAAHRGARVTVEPACAPLVEGTVVAVTAGVPGLAIVGVCRVVRVVDEPDRFGFAYGTVEPHPEVGEESFLLTRTADGGVEFTVRSVSRAVALPARLVPPVARVLIAAYTRIYARSLAREVRRRVRG